MKRVLFISGQQGSGKTTVASYVAQRAHAMHYSPHQMKFADPLYDMHDSIMDILRSYGHMPAPSVNRDLLQQIGTDWGRNTQGLDFWVNILKSRIDLMLTDVKNIVIIDDVRFPNELDLAKNYDSCTVRLNASEDSRKNRAKKWGNTAHSSENSLDLSTNFDAIFDTTNAQLEDVAGSIWQWMVKN
jgi:hypothetical protein